MNHDKWLEQAVLLSAEKMQAGCGGPFGAVIVHSQDETLLAQGWNCVTSCNDPTAHAEMTAIRRATEKLGQFHLQGYTLFSSCEPCPMCLAAIYWAHLDAVFFANTRQQAAAIGFDDATIYEELALPLAQRQKPMVHRPSEHALAVFQQWQTLENKKPY
ncbi:nucleoside deaminase [Magnetococcus sp. PR-3]|uniref:nucleoside deaminase n=1 Tax=Magnetococcus sp. PR-3 TaxID=3120355 RepID=UPI002FCE5910